MKLRYISIVCCFTSDTSPLFQQNPSAMNPDGTRQEQLTNFQSQSGESKGDTTDRQREQ